MINEDLKLYARKNRVFLYEVAERLGCNDANLSRKLRKQFTEEMRNKFIEAVDEIANSRK